MNQKQKKIIITCLAVMALMGVVPPVYSNSYFMGYVFLFYPPLFIIGGASGIALPLSIGIGHLIIQWLVVIFVGITFYLRFNEEK